MVLPFLNTATDIKHLLWLYVNMWKYMLAWWDQFKMLQSIQAVLTFDSPGENSVCVAYSVAVEV